MMTLTFLLSACSFLQSQSSVDELWAIPVSGYGSSSLSGDLFLGYTPESDGEGARISAVSLDEREILWQSEKSIAFDSSPILAVDDNAVYIFLNGKGLFIYSRSGTLLSSPTLPDGDEALGGSFGAAPTLLGTKLFVPNGPHLYAYDVDEPSQPSLLWRRTFDTSVSSLMTTTDGLYIGGVSQSAEGNILKLSPDNGQEIWQANLESFGKDKPFVQALVTVDAKIIAYSYELGGSLQAFDTTTGMRLWATPLNTCSDGAGFVDALEVGGGMVFASPSTGSCLFAVDLATGKEAWTVETGEIGPDGAISIGGKPLYHNGVVYTSVARLWALDAETGKVLSLASQSAYNAVDTVIHYANGEILVWGDELTAYKPVR